jgi:hypothetical protein
MHMCACLEFGIQIFLAKSQEIKKLWSCPPHSYYKEKKKELWCMMSKSYFLVLYDQVQILFMKKNHIFCKFA